MTAGEAEEGKAERGGGRARGSVAGQHFRARHGRLLAALVAAALHSGARPLAQLDRALGTEVVLAEAVLAVRALASVQPVAPAALAARAVRALGGHLAAVLADLGAEGARGGLAERRVAAPAAVAALEIGHGSLVAAVVGGGGQRAHAADRVGPPELGGRLGQLGGLRGERRRVRDRACGVSLGSVRGLGLVLLAKDVGRLGEGGEAAVELRAIALLGHLQEPEGLPRHLNKLGLWGLGQGIRHVHGGVAQALKRRRGLELDGGEHGSVGGLDEAGEVDLDGELGLVLAEEGGAGGGHRARRGRHAHCCRVRRAAGWAATRGGAFANARLGCRGIEL
mmetsp:Transcript_20330/g.57982  ORF Transcript_20330/g.57982 Transcript_20330/m.57982 type:complete len:337 (+) Transcript_20330:126-1136(+)